MARFVLSVSCLVCPIVFLVIYALKSATVVQFSIFEKVYVLFVVLVMALHLVKALQSLNMVPAKPTGKN